MLPQGEDEKLKRQKIIGYTSWTLIVLGSFAL